jgi:hypothetical protein
MSVSRPPPAQRSGIAARDSRRDRWLFGIAMLTLVRAGGAVAADSAPAANADLAPRAQASIPAPQFVGPIFTKPMFNPRSLSDPLLTAPGSFSLSEISPSAGDNKNYSAKDFRPRGRSVFDSDPRIAGPDPGLTFDKTVWQRLNEYRSRDRVRVLTLWESGASTVSIQTDRKGDPSLQWTSRLFNRGGASHGLLDQLFPTSVFGGTTHVTRSPSAQPSKISGALSALHFGNSPPP